MGEAEMEVMHVQAKERQGRLAATGSRGEGGRVLLRAFGETVARPTPGVQTRPQTPERLIFSYVNHGVRGCGHSSHGH